MQHQLSTSTTISPVKPSPIGNRASARVARFAETEAPCAMQFKKALDFSNAKPKARERVRLVETALRAAAQRSAPQASSGARCSDRQHSAISPPTSSVDGKRFRKSRIVAITSFAVALPESRRGGCLAERNPAIGGCVTKEPVYAVPSADGACLARSDCR